MITLELHGVIRIKFGRPGRLFENLINSAFEIRVIGFEQILEEEGQ